MPDKNILPADKHLLPTDKNILPTDKNILPTDKNIFPTDRTSCLQTRNILPIDKNVLPTNRNICLLTETGRNSSQAKITMEIRDSGLGTMGLLYASSSFLSLILLIRPVILSQVPV